MTGMSIAGQGSAAEQMVSGSCKAVPHMSAFRSPIWFLSGLSNVCMLHQAGSSGTNSADGQGNDGSRGNPTMEPGPIPSMKMHIGKLTEAQSMQQLRSPRRLDNRQSDGGSVESLFE